MNIYQIDKEIESVLDGAVDPETGEITPEALEKLDALNVEREQKIESVGLWFKNTLAESKAIAEEISALQARKKSLDSKAEWQKKYLEYALNGEKFETPKLAVSYRKSVSVDFDDAEAFCRNYADFPDLVTTKIERKPNKTEIKKLIKTGFLLDGVRLEEKQNIQIK